ncbi:Os06g0719900 [Oryza sativa Japonica Group]|jgi:hypothetical protein|uniref:Os06g0719900 protein n=1 Tax=Oryza sativa subsp. japonica TaxID=39947 RepID=Q0D9F8_ORYSJ|nr:Os06g0719900 [Oryza sativa Japonica Group]|eukprot:NP_001058601.2 Os06g0719900 [Oryza sativa Japonica Group]
MQARTDKPENFCGKFLAQPEIPKLKSVFSLQLYAPTTLAPAHDFWLLRYTSILGDGSLVVSCLIMERKTNYPCADVQLIPKYLCVTMMSCLLA